MGGSEICRKVICIQRLFRITHIIFKPKNYIFFESLRVPFPPLLLQKHQAFNAQNLLEIQLYSSGGRCSELVLFKFETGQTLHNLSFAYFIKVIITTSFLRVIIKKYIFGNMFDSNEQET